MIFKMNRIKNIFLCWLIRLLGGVPITFHYSGEDKKNSAQMTSYLHYKPFKQTFVIDWTRHEVELFGNKVFEKLST